MSTPLADVDPRLVFPDLQGRTREEILRELSDRLAAAQAVPDADELTRKLLEREALGCTALGGGIAIPHCKLKDLSEIVIAIGRCPVPIDFQSPDGVPVSVLFLIASPAQAPALHLQALARVSRWLKMPGISARLTRATTRDELLDAVRSAQTAFAAQA